MTEKTETGWLIERHQNSQLLYFDGKASQRAGGFDFAGAWTPKHDEAVRFAREQDAAGVLAWCLGGNGRVAEHRWG